MAKLSADVQTFIVQHLAMGDAPSAIARLVKEEFDIVVSRQQVHGYNPNGGHEVAKKWRDLYARTQQVFDEEVLSIPIARRAVRLHRLQRQVDRAEERGNAPLVAQLLEQAAKEVGGQFTNRRELTGKDGKDLIPADPLDQMTDEQLRAHAASLFGGTIAGTTSAASALSPPAEPGA